jgi:hypothetical protein
MIQWYVSFQNEQLETELTILVSLVIIGFTQNVLALIDEAFHLSTFVPFAPKLRICEEDVSENQPELLPRLALHLWHTSPSNHSVDGLENPMSP